MMGRYAVWWWVCGSRDKKKDGKMESMNKLLTKKNVFVVSIIFIGLFLVSGFQKNIGLCGKEYNTCWDFFDWLWQPLSFAIPIFFVSILTYRMREEIFHSWLRFAYWWIPISVLIIFTTPTTDHSWAIGGPTRETMSFVMSGLFLAVSLLIVGIKSLTLRNKEG